jgi:hypothetical protein
LIVVVSIIDKSDSFVPGFPRFDGAVEGVWGV